MHQESRKADVKMQWTVLLIWSQESRESSSFLQCQSFYFVDLFSQTTFVTVKKRAHHEQKKKKNGCPFLNCLSKMTDNPLKVKLTLTVL